MKWGFVAVLNDSYNKYLWQFSFDIKQAALKEVYGKKNYTYAYEDIKRCLQKNGFDNKEDKQGSCYFTSEKMSVIRVNMIIQRMFRELPWLVDCIEKEALTIKERENYNQKEYLELLKNSKEHKKDLERYYQYIKRNRIKDTLAHRNRIKETLDSSKEKIKDKYDIKNK